MSIGVVNGEFVICVDHSPIKRATVRWEAKENKMGDKVSFDSQCNHCAHRKVPSRNEPCKSCLEPANGWPSFEPAHPALAPQKQSGGPTKTADSRSILRWARQLTGIQPGESLKAAVLLLVNRVIEAQGDAEVARAHQKRHLDRVDELEARLDEARLEQRAAVAKLEADFVAKADALDEAQAEIREAREVLKEAGVDDDPGWTPAMMIRAALERGRGDAYLNALLKALNKE